ncbi:hypothetical protein [Aeromonas veronii]|uniref:hypothetical protein n=1 Tax=Aeromonas veronii TaxID=654 RepID=UPI003D2003F0
MMETIGIDNGAIFDTQLFAVGLHLQAHIRKPDMQCASRDKGELGRERPFANDPEGLFHHCHLHNRSSVSR